MIRIFGHKNPDTDSIVAAIALSHLKSIQNINSIPCRLGSINNETKYLLNRFNIEVPELIKNVKTEINDIPIINSPAISLETSILDAITMMEHHRLRAIAVCNPNNYLLGMVDLYDLAIDQIKNFSDNIICSFSNLLKGLKGNQLNNIIAPEKIKGQVLVLNYFYDNLVDDDIVTKDTIAIVGNRFKTLDFALENNVPLVIVNYDSNIPASLIAKANIKNIPIIETSYSTYEISRILPLCQNASTFLRSDDITHFEISEELSVVLNEMKQNDHQSLFPVTNEANKYVGLLNRKSLLNTRGKDVILVDHNEYLQSADGLKEANILEIYDHHKLGDIITSEPVKFKNIPYGSSSTIIYYEYKEFNIKPTNEIAGMLMGGIISDTLFLTSPTATPFDEQALQELSAISGIEPHEMSTEMFKAYTDIENSSASSLFYNDSKWFEIHSNDVLVSQIFTQSSQAIEKLTPEFFSIINDVEKKDNTYGILLITDIIAKGSYIYYSNKSKNIISHSFGENLSPGSFLPSIVSRKKQVMPKLVEAINELS